MWSTRPRVSGFCTAEGDGATFLLVTKLGLALARSQAKLGLHFGSQVQLGNQNKAHIQPLTAYWSEKVLLCTGETPVPPKACVGCALRTTDRRGGPPHRTFHALRVGPRSMSNCSLLTAPAPASDEPVSEPSLGVQAQLQDEGEGPARDAEAQVQPLQ